jgi:hypothetical protein
LQVLEEPRLITEKEDVHLLETFLIGTKQNINGWKINKDSAERLVKDFKGKDFVIIPERIFAPISEGLGGHVSGKNYDDEMAQITTHSHGKITEVKGPYPYNDETDDVFWNCKIKLNSSLSASALIENGSQTIKPFAVSPQIWWDDGPRDDVTDWKPMGLFLVMQPAFGDKAVINKMCNGSELKCGTSLSAAIAELNNSASDGHVAEIISSLVTKIHENNHNMSTQVPQVVSDKIVTEVPQPQINTQPIETPKPETKEETKGVTISPEEYEAYKREREEHKQLVLENKTNKLESIFSSVSDENTKKSLFDKYLGKSDFNSIVEAFDDFNTHILPLKIEAALAEKKDSDNSKKESLKASTLKPEPKTEKNESLSASVVPNNVNEVLVLSKMFEGEII